MKVSILTENTVYKRGFLAEHGLSLLIEEKGKRFLFDTGQSRVFLHNAEKLSLKLQDLDGIILSHGHYDHCGGMEYVQELGKEIPIFVQQKAFEKKYVESSRKSGLRYIGMRDQEEWQENEQIRKLRGGCMRIADGVYLLAEIPYTTEFEPDPKGFWREGSQEKEPELLTDRMEDEQLLIVESDKGLNVFAGCAHPGIINCLQYVQSVFSDRHIHSLVAGMHLKGCEQQRVEKTIQALRDLEIDVVVPLHCTGICAIGSMKEALGERCILAEAGKVIEL